MQLKGHHIDNVEVTEDKDGLHVVIRSTKPSALEPDNTLAVTFSTMSFLIPKDKCEECIWKYTTKNQPIPATDPAKPKTTAG